MIHIVRTHRRLNKIYLLVLKDLLWRCGFAGAHHRGGDTGSIRPGKSSCHKILMEFTINPRYRIHRPQGWLVLGQTTNSEGMHLPPQQIIGLKLYWARPCLPEQDLVFPIINHSQQEAYTSLLASSIRGQTEEDKRSTVSQWLKQKPYYRK